VSAQKSSDANINASIRLLAREMALMSMTAVADSIETKSRILSRLNSVRIKLLNQFYPKELIIEETKFTCSGESTFVITMASRFSACKLNMIKHKP
jgi:hypothetical protein